MLVNKSRRFILVDDYTPATDTIQVDDRKITRKLHPACTTTAERLQTDYEMVIRKALEALPITTKARRLQVLWPLIEQKLLAGTSHADILCALNDGGFDLSERTYKTYVYRFRKRQRKEAPQNQGASPSDSAARTALSSLASRPSPDNDTPKRPATFDFDPRGNPDLLK